MLPARQKKKNAIPAMGLSPSFAKATAGSISIKNGVTKINNKNIANDMGRKYMVFLYLV